MPRKKNNQSEKLHHTCWHVVFEILNRANEIAASPTHGRPAANSDYTPKIEAKARLDVDVVEWLKSQGPRYYSRINAILRAVMEAEMKAREKN